MDVMKRARDESDEFEADLDLPEVKRLREDLFDSLDEDSDQICTSSQDLDSFMKSFEEEITGGETAETSDVASDSGESRPELGYLLEASDDELGIPPATATSSSPGVAESELGSELDRVESVSSDLGSEFWEISNFDSFGYGLGETEVFNGDDVALDGLFEYSDFGFGSGDLTWRAETLPAQ